MVLTITINPSVDKTYIVSNFKAFSLNRATKILYNAGSKGINVSRIVKQLGLETTVLGFVGGHNGDILLRELSAEGINEQMVRVETECRLNIKIMDNTTRMVTEINESGFAVTDNELDKFIEKYKEQIKISSIVVISGSILPKMSFNIYYDLISIANSMNKPVFVDCGGKLLKETIKASPYCIKPNIREFAEMLGKQTLTDEEIIANAKDIINKHGIKCVVVTLGCGGAIGVMGNEVYKVIPPDVVVSSTVGAGDSFLAGLCYGYTKNFNFKKQLILASSCANAKVTKEGNNVPSLIELLGYVEGCQIITYP